MQRSKIAFIQNSPNNEVVWIRFFLIILAVRKVTLSQIKYDFKPTTLIKIPLLLNCNVVFLVF